MKLGVDFGTNRIVVATADRGNFPLTSFEVGDGSIAEWYPSLIAVGGSECVFGWAAWEKQGDDAWTILRSVKRLLEKAGPQTALEIGGREFALGDLLLGLTADLAACLRERSNLQMADGEPLEIMLGVPANANTNQRFLTLEAFRRAGFQVLGVLNEPSAASIEFGHRQRQSKAVRETILVYDLGGGTFDASLVAMDGRVHHVLASDGISTVGGDDFDEILAELALEAAGVGAARAGLTRGEWFRLLEECRRKKETLHPNSRRLAIELDCIGSERDPVQVAVADFYERARPLVEETLAVAEDLVSSQGNRPLEALYITGGGSELPLVARVLRERFGRRVRRSAYARSASAIGLAIQADMPGAYELTDQLGRFFGVWRERESGTAVAFDPIFDRDLALPQPGAASVESVRRYQPKHTVGHLRFLECSHLAADGSPSGEVALWDEIWFPYEAQLRDAAEAAAQVVRISSRAEEQWIEESYRCDAAGAVSVEIQNVSAGYGRTYTLGRWNR